MRARISTVLSESEDFVLMTLLSDLKISQRKSSPFFVLI